MRYSLRTIWQTGRLVVSTVIEFLHAIYENMRSLHGRKANTRFPRHNVYRLIHEHLKLHNGYYRNQLPAQLPDALGETD